MILQYGAVENLQGKDWYLLELRSEKTVEPTMRRIGKQIPGIFKNDPVEIFIPLLIQDLNVFELKTQNYIFVRSSSLNSLARFKSVTGVVSLVTEGEMNRTSRAIPIKDEYVQQLIKEAEEEFSNRGSGIEVGTFVRILNGETRDYCGFVEVVNEGTACVRVDLKTKSLLIETPVRNLLSLPNVPPEQRVFYYCDLVSDLAKDELLDLISEDLQIQTEHIVESSNSTTEPKRHSRQRTVTALVRKLILIEREYDPMKIASAVVEALKNKTIKEPKNLFIAYSIIKDNLFKLHFKVLDPNLKSFREVVHKYGKQYKFSANDIARLDPTLGIPVLTVEVCKDGRSREARLKAKQVVE